MVRFFGMVTTLRLPFALDFAQRALCAAAILALPAAEIFRVARPRPDVPPTPLSADIARSNFARSAFNLRYYCT